MNPEAGSVCRPVGVVRFTLALVLVLTAGLLVRVVGIDHGSPTLVWHPDVAKQAQVAQEVYQGDLDLANQFGGDLKRTLYPYGTPVLLGHAMKVRALAGGREAVEKVHRWSWAYRLRWTAVCIFLAAVLLSLALYRHGLTPFAAVAAGLLMVLEPSAALDSHYGMNDVPLAALLLLAWAASVRIASEPSRLPWASLVTGLALGLAGGVKYQAVLGLIFPLTAWVNLYRRRHWRGLASSAAMVVLFGSAALVFTSPLLRSDPAQFLSRLPAFMHWQANIMENPLPLGAKVLRNLASVGSLLVFKGLVLLLAGGLYGAWQVWRAPKLQSLRGAVCSAWLFSGLLGAAVLFGRDFVRANDLLPLWPFMAMLTGLGFAAPQPKKVHAAALSAAFGLVLWFGVQSFGDAFALSRPDTRERARDWCLENIPRGRSVVRERYTLRIEKPGVAERAVRYLADRDLRGAIRRGEPDFLISSSLAYDRFFDPRLPYFDPANQQFYKNLSEGYDPVAVFSDRRLLFGHPVVTVYRVKPDGAEQPGPDPGAR